MGACKRGGGGGGIRHSQSKGLFAFSTWRLNHCSDVGPDQVLFGVKGGLLSGDLSGVEAMEYLRARILAEALRPASVYNLVAPPPQLPRCPSPLPVRPRECLRVCV